MKDNVELQIDELVLNGFGTVDQQAIGEAVERELTRLLLEQGIDAPLNAGSDARTIGADVAKAVITKSHP